MELLINAVMIITLLNAMWWMVCDVTGNLFFKFLAKGVFGFGGLLLPSIYFLKMFEII